MAIGIHLEDYLENENTCTFIKVNKVPLKKKGKMMMMMMMMMMILSRWQ